MGPKATSLPTVDKEVLRRRIVLSHHQQLHFCSDIIDTKIYTRLCAIGDYKFPSMDGYNAIFFMKVWRVIHREVRASYERVFQSQQTL